MQEARVRNVLNKTLLLGLVLYFLVLGYFVERAVEVETLEPYGVNLLVYGFLLTTSELVLTITLIWIFVSEKTVWPSYAEKAVVSLKSVNPLKWLIGLGYALRSAFNLSILDLRLTSRLTVWLGRMNRLFAGLPFVYILAAGHSGLTTLGFWLVSLDLVLTYTLWLAMEAYIVDPSLRLPIFKRVRGDKSFRRAARIIAGPAKPSEAGQIAEVEDLAWGEGHARTEDIYIQRMKSFGQGVIVARNSEGRVLAVLMATPCNASELLKRPTLNFDEIADQFGADINGKDLWGITLSVPPRFRKTGASTAIEAELYKLILPNYRDLWLGSRIPDYNELCSLYLGNGLKPPTTFEYASLSVGEVRKALGNNWARGRKDEEYADTELEYYRGLGFTQVRVEPNYYLRDDPPDGVIIKRRNPLYIVPGIIRRPLVHLIGDAVIRRTLYR